MKRILFTLSVILSLLLTVGCTPKSSYKELEAQNIELKNRVKELEELLVSDKDVVDALSKTESDAISYVEDYYNFYRSDYSARNIQVRQRSGGQFDVSLQEVQKYLAKHGSDLWIHVNYRLTISSNGEYEMARIY